MSGPLNFASWVQPAAAGALPHDDANNNATAPTDPPPNLELSVSVQLTSTLAGPTTILAPHGDMRLLGPGDVVGVDSDQIVRRFPAPGTAGALTTHLAFIDFAATDLPWRFSMFTATPTTPPPSSGTAENRVRPWLVLLAVTADNQLSTDGSRITVPAEQLPDLTQSWAWAHAQLDNPADPSTGRARLLCPRQLPSNVAMRAILVPAFKAGVAAALGTQPPTNPYEPAWHPGASVELPVYDSWTFTTGDNLDFETLAKRITPLPADAITGLGSIPIDVSDLVASGGVVPADSALGPIKPDPLTTDQQNLLSQCAQWLVTDINTDVADHALCPPIRGQYHVGRSLLDPTAATWLDMANRDPRLRLAAARGADWVNANQEDLMAQAWQQAGQVREASRQLAAARAALAITDSLHTRHVLPRSIDDTIRLTSPAARQLPVAAGAPTHDTTPPSTVADVLTASAAPQGVGSTHMARLTRTLAGLKVSTPALTSTTGAPIAPTGTTLTRKALTGALLGMPGVSKISTTMPLPPAPVGPDIAAPDPSVWGMRLLIGPNRATKTQDYLTQQQTLVGEVDDSLSAVPTAMPGITATLITGGGVNKQPITPNPVNHGLANTGQLNLTALTITNDAATAVWGSTPSPNNAVAQRIASRLTTAAGHSPVANTPPGPIAVRPAITHGLDTELISDMQLVLPTPQVGAPMALALLERDPNWLVGGATDFPDDKATLLKPDAAVIEAIFLGANYAMLDEYLWRGFPTDRRGTPIRRFWPTADPNHVDIPTIDQWDANTALGTHLDSDSSTTLIVLMLRTELFQRYPDMVVGAVRAMMGATGLQPNPGAQLTMPAFPVIAVDERTRIIGFDLGIDPAVLAVPPSKSTPGWYFVFIEPPTGLRFGFDPPWPGGTNNAFLDNPIGEPIPFSTSAELAVQALQLPVRVFLHSSQMVAAPHG